MKVIILMTVVYAALIAPFTQAALIPSEGNFYQIVRLDIASDFFTLSSTFLEACEIHAFPEYRSTYFIGYPFVLYKQSTLSKILPILRNCAFC